MTNPLRASFYADQACQVTVSVEENVPVARDTYRLRVGCPEIARQIVPGQFVMLRLAGCDHPLLGRPMALYDTALDHKGQPVGIDLVYLVVGTLTRKLARLQVGQELEVWGPLGNSFSPQPAQHLVMVAGGIGQTPFLALAQEHLGRRTYGTLARRVPKSDVITLCYGVRTGDLAACVEDFNRQGVRVRLSSDDGTIGHHGLVTDVLRDVLDNSTLGCRIVCCGPELMMAAVSQIARKAGIACQVSLETPMACGIGICFSCVAKLHQNDGSWDYKRTCVDGPIFDAEKIVW